MTDADLSNPRVLEQLVELHWPSFLAAPNQRDKTIQAGYLARYFRLYHLSTSDEPPEGYVHG